MRIYVSGPLVSFLAPRLIGDRLRGVARGVAKTMLNVCIASPISSGIIAALFSSPDDFASVYVTALATTMPMAMFVSFFIVGPAVKLVFHNRIKPASGLHVLQTMQSCAPTISRILGM